MPIKLTLKEVTDLLASAGVPHVEIVDKDELSDYVVNKETVTPDSLLVGIDTARESIIAPKVIAAKTGEIHSTVAGKINGALRSQLSQKTGIPAADLKDLDSAAAIQKAYDFLISTIGGDKTTLIAERDSLMQKHSEAIKAKDIEWQGKLDGVTSKLTEKEIIARLVKDHNEAKGLPPTANKTELAKMFKSNLDSGYKVKYNEATDEIELYDKANPDTRVYTNDTKTAYAKASDLMKPFYTNIGLWNEDARTVNPADAMKDKAHGTYVVEKQGDAPRNRVDAGNDAFAAYAKAAQGK